MTVSNISAADATDYIKVFFNQPEESTSTSEIANPDKGIDDALVDFIDSAKSGDTLYASFYEIKRDKIVNAFNRAVSTRGVTLYFIADDPAGNDDAEDDYSSLDTGNKKLGNTNGIMHNKFCVLKDSAVWTGSYNITDKGTEDNNNNAVLIYSKELARIYENEFLHMYEDNKFSDSKTLSTNTARTVKLSDETIVEVYFSPYPMSSTNEYETDTRYKIMDLIENAEYSVFFNMFTFTVSESDYIQKSLVETYKAGVEVKGVVDAIQSSTVQSDLREVGMDVMLDANRGKLHHKFAVIDYGSSDPVVVTGAYNWTGPAREDNDENFLVIHSREVADLYWQEFQKNYALAGGSTQSGKEAAVSNTLVYPSPAKNVNKVTIGYELSPAVFDVTITLYTLYGEEVIKFDLEDGDFYPGTYNEKRWDLQNSSSNDVAPGLYIVQVSAETGDGVFHDTQKFAVIR